MSLKKWSLDKVKFLMSHIEDFVDEEGSHLVSRTAKDFQASSDIQALSELSLSEPETREAPFKVLERLVPYYEFGFLAQKSISVENSTWWITNFFWKGNIFRLALEDQLEAQKFVPPLTPLEMRKGRAPLFLKGLNLDFIECPEESEIFALRPTSHTTYFLATNLPAPWLETHLEETRKLINKAFNF
jgi:hypothetical protein